LQVTRRISVSGGGAAPPNFSAAAPGHRNADACGAKSRAEQKISRK
jgi:hypothetical protein